MIFDHPSELLAFYDPSFQDGEYSVYPWQVAVQRDFAHPVPPGKQRQIIVCAANGSGKSKTLIAPAAVWMAMSFKRSCSVITTASGTQLDRQSLRYVKDLASAVNAYHGAELWEIQYRHLEFKPNGSVIDALATDEKGRMEGWHPLDPGAEFGFFVDEGKTVAPDIYSAIMRCNGVTRRMDVSSPGEPSGDFFNNFISGRWIAHRITADDCPHITDDFKAEVISTYGKDSPITKSILYAEFSALSGSTVLSLPSIQNCIRLGKEGAIEHHAEPDNRAGLDLSGGGDETILSVWNGNKQLAIELVPTTKENETINYLVEILFPKWKLKPERIWADAGGMGRTMIRVMGEKGYPGINMVYNQSAPLGLSKLNFGNRGTEMWHQFGRLVDDSLVILLDDRKHTEQLANRYYDQQLSTDKIIVEPKPKARARGRPSPDRADASVLALCKYRVPKAEAVQVESRRKMTEAELMDYYDNMVYGQEKPRHHGNVTLETVCGERLQNSWRGGIPIL